MEDLDYIIEAHVRIYHLEYQFDESFNRFITDAVYSFRENMNGLNEMVFILELEGRPKGSIGITRLNDDTAQLRWFLLEKEARGRGWGRKLIEEALRFAEAKQYKTISLWTNQRLTAARSLYKRHGFSIVESKVEILSNQEMIEERWEYRI